MMTYEKCPKIYGGVETSKMELIYRKLILCNLTLQTRNRVQQGSDSETEGSQF